MQQSPDPHSLYSVAKGHLSENDLNLFCSNLLPWLPSWNRSQVLTLLGFFCGTGVWTQDFVLAKPGLYCLSHTSSPICSGYFWDGGSRELFCLSWPQTMILSISAFQVPRITGMSHSAWSQDLTLTDVRSYLSLPLSLWPQILFPLIHSAVATLPSHTLPPQGLCTSCFFCLECSAPRFLHSILSSYLRHLLSKPPWPPHLKYKPSPPSTPSLSFYPLFFSIVLTNI
jgi:hypothetical protein